MVMSFTSIENTGKKTDGLVHVRSALDIMNVRYL